MPKGAKIGHKGTVTWTSKGSKRTGKLSDRGKVSVQSNIWTAQFTDETGTVRRVSTKTANRVAAEKILAKYEAEIDRIRAGVATREELTSVHSRRVTLEAAMEKFRTKLIASGNTPVHIRKTLKMIDTLCQETGIDSVTKFRRETVERWIATEVETKTRSPSTINHYLTAIKSFLKYVVEIELLPKDPIKSIRKLNQEIGQRKKRRAMTDDEVERLLQVASSEQVLIYRLLLGTGLRSTELSLLTPGQIDFDRCRLTIEAAKTKNKRADVLPIRI